MFGHENQDSTSRPTCSSGDGTLVDGRRGLQIRDGACASGHAEVDGRAGANGALLHVRAGGLERERVARRCQEAGDETGSNESHDDGYGVRGRSVFGARSEVRRRWVSA